MTTILHYMWRLFDAVPEGVFKMRMRFFLAFNPFVPSSIRRMSPVRASINNYVPHAGDIVVDAGAFPGDYTVYASRKVGPEGRIVAFEPNPVNFKQLKHHVEAFDLQNVTLLQKGLWSKDCTLKMAGAGVDTHVVENGEHEVELVSLDKELQRLGIHKVDVIKMDIEGAEIRALEGAHKTLMENDIHLAIGSYHEFEGEVTKDKTEHILKSLGYKYFTGYPERPNTYAWKEHPAAGETHGAGSTHF
ncbi:MAG: FkbM family methyltransferase [Verrucomicrobia bacterium]|nr:FkbM family methyltransferase [Verrucomicrobiota bacterium]